jgi:hypothetical protein
MLSCGCIVIIVHVVHGLGVTVMVILDPEEFSLLRIYAELWLHCYQFMIEFSFYG